MATPFSSFVWLPRTIALLARRNGLGIISLLMIYRKQQWKHGAIVRIVLGDRRIACAIISMEDRTNGWNRFDYADPAVVEQYNAWLC
jgi:hypothetical protein